MADLTFRGRRVVRDRALVMAIINRTPDSFYDRGATFDPTTALDELIVSQDTLEGITAFVEKRQPVGKGR